MYTYYFLENGEVVFIENFENASDAKECQKRMFPKSTLAVRVGSSEDE